jgi:hypothetical protein
VMRVRAMAGRIAASGIARNEGGALDGLQHTRTR